MVDSRATMSAPTPPRTLKLLVGASLALSAIPAAHAVQYARDWSAERAGKPLDVQRATLGDVPWFYPPFMEFARRLTATLPRGARVLVEPTEPPRDVANPIRWFVFLNAAVYPHVELYAREPMLASGTVLDFPLWLEHHFEPRDESTAAAERAALAERGIEWRLRLPMDRPFDPDRAELARLEAGRWLPVPLSASERRERREE